MLLCLHNLTIWRLSMDRRIVKYDNRLNELRFPDFREQELNIFCNLLHHLKDREQETLKFSVSEVRGFFGSAYDSKTLAYMLKRMLGRMKERGFEYIERNGYEITRHYVTMFPTFSITTEPNPNAIDELDSEILKSLEVRINPDFSYLINKLEKNFTRFELAEFVSISSKYTKRLYMNLKQYRKTGYMRMEWGEFMRIMDISYTRQTDIDQFILKPAIKELTKPRNLFDIQRTPFKNLKYTKIKKGGNKVVAIEFRFDPEIREETIESSHYSDEIKEYIRRAQEHFFSKGETWLHINNIRFIDDKIQICFDGKDIKPFDKHCTLEEFEKEVKPFVVNAFKDKHIYY